MSGGSYIKSYMKYARSIIRVVIGMTTLILYSGCGNRVATDNMVSDTDEYVADTVAYKEPEPEIIINTYEDAMEYMRNSGFIENYRNGILPELARDNIGYARRLLKNKFSRFIIVDKSTMQVILYNKYGEIEKRYGMACARNYGNKRKKADNRTPEGFFTVTGIYDSTEWLYTDDEGVTSQKKGQFGPRFIRIAPQIGIHGTCSPWSIGHRTSHGCIRLTNENILDLVQYAEEGMPVIVNPGSKDLAVNKREGYDSFSIVTIPGTLKAKHAHENFDGYLTRKQNDTIVRETADSISGPAETKGEESGTEHKEPTETADQ